MTSYTITITKTSGETYTGTMTRKQPEIVNGFIALALDNGEWVYIKPDVVEEIRYVPVVDEPAADPVETEHTTPAEDTATTETETETENSDKTADKAE